MAQLTKEMYGSALRPIVGPFGLSTGQKCVDMRIVDRDGGWYTKRGERLGFGELSAHDFLKIISDIDNDELFIILDGTDAYWNFQNSKTGSMAKLSIDAPGIDYVAKHAQYVLAHKQAYYVADYPQKIFKWDNGLRLRPLTSNSVKEFMTSQIFAHYLKMTIADVVAFAPEIHATKTNGTTKLRQGQKDAYYIKNDYRFSHSSAIGDGHRESPFEYGHAQDISPYYSLIDLWLRFCHVAFRRAEGHTFIRANDFLFVVEPDGITAEDGGFTKFCDS
ncbi:MAG: hypothetical protein AAB920_00495 [Patescibacteria group bacterium]